MRRGGRCMSGFLTELKRRNVFKVAVIYAVTGWVLVQVASIALPAFVAPDWVLRVFLFFVLLGFPFALIMAWALELTPEGIKRDKAEVGEKRMWAIAIILAVAATGWHLHGAPDNANKVTEAGVENQSIAVLPFKDFSPQGDHEYFGDGIAEEILNLLAKNPALHVAGRTSSFKFRGNDTDLREIGRQLNVAHLLEGSIRKSGNRLRITAQLIDTESGFHLWSDTYDRELTDVFEVQDQISAAIVDALEATIADGEDGYATGNESRRPLTTSTSAYELYLRGRSLGARRGAGNIEDAIRLMEAAVVLDPEFAGAWGHLAYLYAMGGLWRIDVPAETRLSRSREAAQQALALDPENIDALLGVGTAKLYQEYDIDGARDALLKANSLAPNNADVANFVGDYYGRVLDLPNQAKFESLAAELDPLSAVQYLDLAWVYIIRGEVAKGVEAAEQARKLDNDINVFWEGLHDVYLAAERWDDARAIQEQIVLEIGSDSFEYFYTTMSSHIARGEFDAVRSRLATLEDDMEVEDWSVSYVALMYKAIGDCDNAAKWMVRAYENHDSFLSYPSFLTSAAQCPDSAAWQAFWQRPGFKELSELRIANGIPAMQLYGKPEVLQQ